MDTQKKPTLVEKQKFWAEQRPHFEEKYWLSDCAEFLVFDMEQGNYVVKESLDPIYADDANDTFHRVNTGWAMWKKAIVFCRDAQKVDVPEGFVLVDKSHTGDWYLDPHEHMWFEQDGIDGWLSELNIGDVEAIEHKEYLITKNTPVFATKVWDDSSNNVGCWEFFNNKEEAEKAAAYCKAKFNNDPNDVLSELNEEKEEG